MNHPHKHHNEMPTSSERTHRLQQRILFHSLALTLVTGLLVGISTALPFYQHGIKHAEAINQLHLAAEAKTIASLLERFGETAGQFTSRSQIRDQLARYNRGEVDRDEMVSFTHPRLGDAVSQARDVLGVARADAKGEVVVKIGLVPPHLLDKGSPASLDDTLWQEGERTYLLRGAAITGRDGEYVGYDLLTFSLEPLHEQLSAQDQFGMHSRLFTGRLDWEQWLGSEIDLPGLQLLPLPAALRQSPPQDMAVYQQQGRQNLLIAPVPGEENWVLALQQRRDELHAPAHALLLFPLLIMVLVITGAVFLNLRLIRPLADETISNSQRLSDLHRQMDQIAGNIPGFVYQSRLDQHGRQHYLYASPGIEDIFGIRADEAITEPQRSMEAIYPDDLQKVKDSNHYAASTMSRWHCEFRVKHPGKGLIWVEGHASPIQEPQGEIIWYGHMADITRRKQQEAALRHQANTDNLTGISNRSSFLQALEQELERFHRYPNPAAILMIDLDHFKKVNDNYGHPAGDRVLKGFAHLTNGTLREVDRFGRLGGEEFAILLPDTDAAGALRYAERLRNNIASATFSTEQGDISVTISIGISLFQADDQTVQTIISRADNALYRAKQQGRNRCELNTTAAIPSA